MGFQILLLVFAAVTLGGLGTAFGALVGSLIVGLFIQLSTLFMPAELKNVGALGDPHHHSPRPAAGHPGPPRASRLRRRGADMDWGNILSNSLIAAVGVQAVIYALAAIGLNMHFGYTGLLNFGQAGLPRCRPRTASLPRWPPGGCRCGSGWWWASSAPSSSRCCWAFRHCGCEPTTSPS